MTDRPIIFSAPMVLALLAGRKTQTRRIIRPDMVNGTRLSGVDKDGSWLFTKGCTYGKIKPPYRAGDRLYVREAFALAPPLGVRYVATDAIHDLRKKRPSIHMPRWASRITLLVDDVSVQPLQDISEADALAEGIVEHEATMTDPAEYTIGPDSNLYHSAREAFGALWNSLHGPDAWDANPSVVAITFRVQLGNIDQIGAPAE
ncbi:MULTISPECIES: hypothetical protein [unclassified Sphingomonas]|jgi:hypothetical protein|uniref:hypothetical protein n=1 Tax=unclassified Sphingomonas TaxID=196159 RepID=UPI000835F084|nr:MULTISPECIES: hypothetical protein [unclassified Sphingomonas]